VGMSYEYKPARKASSVTTGVGTSASCQRC